MVPRLVRTLNGVCARASRDGMTTIPTVSAVVEAGEAQHRHTRALGALVAVGPGLGLGLRWSTRGPHIAEQRVIKALGVSPATGAFGAKVTMGGGLGGPRGECSVAAGWLPRSSESS